MGGMTRLGLRARSHGHRGVRFQSPLPCSSAVAFGKPLIEQTADATNLKSYGALPEGQTALLSAGARPEQRREAKEALWARLSTPQRRNSPSVSRNLSFG